MAPSRRPSAALAAAAATVVVCGVHGFSNPWEALPPAFDENRICVEGPVGDAMCDSESVERANAEQLHSILQELTDTTFFRLFRVNLGGHCPFERFAAQDTHECAPVVHPETSGRAPFLSGKEAPVGGSCTVDNGHTDHALVPHDDTDFVDRTLSIAEGSAVTHEAQSADCDDEELPHFWLDMCDRIPTGEGEMVSLRLNPESDTGYNGSHIWRAIYQENCFVRASEPNAMCLEERVLYRLLSGMHASTNIHVAMHHNSSHSLHAGPLAIFTKHFGNGQSERLRDLHFAFVVLLRAVQKGNDVLQSFPYETRNDEGEGTRTAALMQRLLDSCILQSCSSVFSAFDEALLFQHPHEHTWWSLKRQFKGVFHNISSIVDCVSCQKCRLHGKLQLLGLGTALKWLLLPADLIRTASSREEVVALVNTLSKFSRAITWSKKLAAQARSASTTGARKGDATVPPVVSTQLPRRADSGDEQPKRDVADLVDTGVSLIAQQARAGVLTQTGEARLLALVRDEDPFLISLIRHYGKDASRHFHLPLSRHGATPTSLE